MIDLHLHTTASDGRHAPAELVARARAAGVSVLGVTDHDTVGGCREAEAACSRAGLTFVPGIEVTSVVEGMDVHVLGYFIDVDDEGLRDLLAAQRRHRIDRVREIVARLARHGTILTDGGRLNLRNAAFTRDSGPLDPGCSCPVCARWSRGYLRHLLRTQEPTAARLLTIHNVGWLLGLVRRAQAAISDGTLASLQAEVAAAWD